MKSIFNIILDIKLTFIFLKYSISNWNKGTLRTSSHFFELSFDLSTLYINSFLSY